MIIFSIITPVYNSEKYLKKCIESVRNQSFTNWELIMVDDGSKDSSYSIMRNYAEKDNRIKIKTKKNEGPGLTRNCAMQMAEGEYLVFLDSDDYIESDYLEKVAEKVTEGCDVIFIDVIQENPDGTLIKYENMSAFKSLSKHDLVGMQMVGTMPWGGCRKISKRSIVTGRDMRYTEDAVGEEAIFSFDLLVSAEKIAFVEKHLYHYVNHPQSQSKSSGEGWSLTAKRMKQHLIECHLLKEYDLALNTFAYTALCGRLLSAVKSKNYTEVKQEMDQRIDDFEKDFCWNIDKKYLRREAKLLLPFLRRRQYLLPSIGGKVYATIK